MTKVLLCFLVFVMPTLARAEVDEPEAAPPVGLRGSDFQISTLGHVGVEGVVYGKPSGKAGQSDFAIPHAGIEFKAELPSVLVLRLAPQFQSPVASGSELSIHHAEVELAVSETLQFKAGLIEPTWFRGHEGQWRWRYLSQNLNWAESRWGYLPDSDYGFELNSETESRAFGLTVVNGEGRGNSERGPQKDFSLWGLWRWGFEFGRSLEVSALVLRGGYEDVPLEDSAKWRGLLQISTTAPRGWGGGFLLVGSQDPADAINAKVADQVDLTGLGGQTVKGRLTSFWLDYQFELERGRGWRALIRGDAVDPVAAELKRSVTSLQVVADYQIRPGIEWLFQFSSLAYGEEHALAVRDEQTGRVSLHVSWK